jgi:hypothetical protein
MLLMLLVLLMLLMLLTASATHGDPSAWLLTTQERPRSHCSLSRDPTTEVTQEHNLIVLFSAT